MSETSSEKVLLGRPGNNVSMGIVGLPNVGKSLLFNILTKLDVPSENFPFCTKEPNLSRTGVPDARFEWLVEHWQPERRFPAYLQVVDIAGLVKGASEGLGLGNAFLSNIRAVDGIFHVVRSFEDVEITHVEDSIDPVRDLEIIASELLKKDQEVVEKQLETMSRKLRSGDKATKEKADALEKMQECMKNGTQIRFGHWTAAEADVINEMQLLTAKPVIFLVNMSEKSFIKRSAKHLKAIKEWVEKYSGNETIIPFAAKLESTVVNMSADEKQAYIDKLKEDYLAEKAKEVKISSQIEKIIVTGYEALGLIHYFTAGKDEVKCWTIRKGTKAPQAAGVIHTDFEKGFQQAEVIKFEDMKEQGSESAVKAAGKMQMCGKAYEVQDGDIIFFKVNTSGMKKK